MAKTQTFGDKVKKKKGDGRTHVKVIGTFRTETGAMRFREKIISVEDTNVLDKLEINL